MDRQMEGRIEGWMVDERMDRRTDGRTMNGWIDGVDPSQDFRACLAPSIFSVVFLIPLIG